MIQKYICWWYVENVSGNELYSNFRHMVPVVVTFPTNFTDNGSAAGKFRYTKAVTFNWDNYLPAGQTAKQVVFSHITCANDNGLFAYATPYYKNSTEKEQHVPTTWKIWCEYNVYCYGLFLILY